jgi:N-formylglutamate deformylase
MTDAKLQGRQAARGPVLVTAPAGDAPPVPLVYDSPHSGRDYPEDFAPAVPLERLWGYEDRLVDDLVADAPALGIALVAACFPRAYVDPNRAEDDLDAEVLGAEHAPPGPASALAAKGIGLVFRTLPDGTAIYERPIGRAAVEARIARFWRPYHAALDGALEAAQRRHGAVWHVSWHSMRPVGDALSPDPGARRPDFVVSDLDGRAADGAFTAAAVEELERLGRSVAVNRPFKGGYITRRHGRPEAGRHSIQIEINRGLYIDLDSLEPLPAMAGLREELAAFSAALAARVRGFSGS